MRTSESAAFLLSLVLCAGPAAGGELAGVTLPDQIAVDSKTLVLNGLGLREATMLKVDVYVAGLYLEKKSSDPGEITGSEQAKRLVLKFVRSVGRAEIVKAWNEGFEKSAGQSKAALQERIAAFNSWMSDMPIGATLSFTYLPGTGVQVEVRGETRGTLSGPDFAQALFGIWLGQSPPNPGLKEGLLGRN